MLQLTAGAERLCHFFEWGRELMSYFQMGREMKKVGNHCSNRSSDGVPPLRLISFLYLVLAFAFF